MIDERRLAIDLKDKKRRTTNDMKELTNTINEYRKVSELMDELPKKFRHPIMVPLGTKAFMPGYLIHTNEVLMQLSSDIFVSRTAVNCKKSLQRRLKLAEQSKPELLKTIKELDIKIETIRDVDLSSLKNMRAVTEDESNQSLTVTGLTAGVHKTVTGHFEIVEEYYSDNDEIQEASSGKLPSKKTCHGHLSAITGEKLHGEEIFDPLVVEGTSIKDRMTSDDRSVMKPKSTLSKFRQERLKQKLQQPDE